MTATKRRAVIGSANASENSAFAVDAVKITDDPDIIASVREFIDGIDKITEVDAVPIPGVTGRIRNPRPSF